MATNGSDDLEARRRRIGLAAEPVRRLGPLTIEPALRRIAHDDGNEEIVEPRVMQVLIALLDADGGTVSRDDLVFSCWEGRIVGDDAINRVLSRLRRVAEGIGGGAFRIETLTKVGYRLVAEGIGTARRRRSRLSWASPSLWAAITAFIVVLLGGGLFASRWSGTAIPSVALVNQGHGRDMAMLAGGLAADLSRLTAARASDLRVVETPATSDYVVGVAGDRRGDQLHAELTLFGRAGGELLWSISFDRAASEAADLRQQIAVKLGDVLFCTLHGAQGVDSATLRLFLSYCDHRHDLPSVADVDLLNQVVARAPGFARARAMLAKTEADLGAVDEVEDHRDTPELKAFRTAAFADLIRARALDSAIEETYYAEARIDVDPRHWAERLAILDRGITHCPAPLLYQAEVMDLLRVGRMHDAVAAARNAVALDPLSPWNREALISALAYSGQGMAARAELERAERLWPGSTMMRDVRYRFDLRYGDPANALRLLDKSDDPHELSASPTVERPFLLARIAPNAATIQAAVQAGQPQRNGLYPSLSSHLQTLGTFGQVQEAYRVMDATEASNFWGYGTFVLFRPQMRSLWLDRRFFAFTTRIGLADYWIRSGHWPDFCLDPDLPYDCRAEAQRLSRKLPAAPARM